MKIELAAALFLTGLSWFLQLVQLPILLRLDAADFSKIAALHRRRNTLLMAGPMAIEMAAAIWLLRSANAVLVFAFVLLVAIWAITFLRHVPLHAALLRGYDRETLESIARWNWVRTLAWTARSALLIFTLSIC
jgi:hypothetical protein